MFLPLKVMWTFSCIHPGMESLVRVFLFGLIRNTIGFVTITHILGTLNRLREGRVLCSGAGSSCVLCRDLGAE